MFMSSQSKCQFLEAVEEGRALNVLARPKYGSGKYCEPLLDAQQHLTMIAFSKTHLTYSVCKFNFKLKQKSEQCTKQH